MRYPVGKGDVKFNQVTLQGLDDDITKINSFASKIIFERAKDKNISIQISPTALIP